KRPAQVMPGDLHIDVQTKTESLTLRCVNMMKRTRFKGRTQRHKGFLEITLDIKRIFPVRRTDRETLFSYVL
ncbi:hypothetical protein, partial [Pantoea ananatis]|uniref:hypothetical protein n=1 Tax=Pantoea ananas TaxID=553 RepID=UPI001B30F242